MDRKFLHKNILKQFPDVEFHLKLSSLFFYNKLVGKPLNDFKQKHIEELNRKSRGSNAVKLVVNKNLPKSFNTSGAPSASPRGQKEGKITDSKSLLRNPHRLDDIKLGTPSVGREIAHFNCGLAHLLPERGKEDGNFKAGRPKIDEQVDAIGTMIGETANNAGKLLSVSNTKMHKLITQVEKNNLF